VEERLLGFPECGHPGRRRLGEPEQGV
jgi:hypothetical protein